MQKMMCLPDDLKDQLKRTSAETGRGEADPIREGAKRAVGPHAPSPTIPISVSDDPRFAEQADERMAGFGER
jgi:hypothetical protein